MIGRRPKCLLRTIKQFILESNIENLSKTMSEGLLKDLTYLKSQALFKCLNKQDFLFFIIQEKKLRSYFYSLHTDNMEIKRPTVTKCLAVIINKNISWKCHTELTFLTVYKL